ncbi:MAG: UvrD-helicase domain-containing protein [Acidimicrobiales bacterium]
MAEPQIPPPDQAGRDRIATDLGSTLFVEAGAGTGKTTALVQRVLALVGTGLVPLASLAAITFTEKAGAELRQRLRVELETRAGTEDPTGFVFRIALDQLDGAAIGTLHSFARRLLSEHPVEAGLPPKVEVLDDVGSQVAFERRWSVFRDAMLDDPGLERTILLLMAAGVRPAALRSLAEAFNDNWDLVQERVPENASEPPPVRPLFMRARDAINAVCAEPCLDPTDRLGIRLDQIMEHLDALEGATDEFALLEALDPDKLPSFRVGNIGRKASFARDVADVRNDLSRAAERLESVRLEVAAACAHRLGGVIRRFTIDAAEDRRRAGQLEFHDLLVLARELLRHDRHGPAVRSRLHGRYQRLLLDEFQDTDPIQIELAVRLAAAEPVGMHAGSDPWEDVEVSPGHLFFVGDPKQSIYRFRRADISTFLAAEGRFGSEGDGLVQLTANFRTSGPIIEWVNDTFARLMKEPVDVTAPVPSQPHYAALEATRDAPHVGPSVALLGRAPHPGPTPADRMRSAEADEVAATITRAMDEGWQVGDGAGGWRTARLGDVAVLVPSRTSLPFLELSLEGRAIPFRTESSSLVYGGQAVRDLLMLLRAIDDPTNHLFIVSALRTPLLGCGDDDLFRFRHQRKGRWSYLTDQPDTVPDDDPVRIGLAYLRSVFEQRHWLAPSELLGLMVRDRRAMELGFVEGKPRDIWRRLRFVIDQARVWSEATGGNLRQYLGWVDQQCSDGAGVTESVLPETDDDAVRIMTIHSAKGLEFPITIVSGMSTVPRSQRAPAEVVFPPTGQVGYRFGAGVSTYEYQVWAPVDEQMGLHERIRLLYVACTRARDHLVVSLHRKQRNKTPSGALRTNAELLVDGMATAMDHLPDGAGAGGALNYRVRPSPLPPIPMAAWRAERNAALARASHASAVAATALTDEAQPDPAIDPDPGLQKRPRDLDLPPWLKGRYGTSVGRAVHGVLQTISLADPIDLDAVVAAQCQAEAVVDRAQEVRRLATDALSSPSVRQAACCSHWREVYAATPIGGRLLEGYIDLLYRGPDGLVVIDYKTSASSDPAELQRRLADYRFQGASYALAVGSSTGEPVVRVTFVFLTPTGAVERHLPDLEAAMDEVAALVSSDREVTVD